MSKREPYPRIKIQTKDHPLVNQWGCLEPGAGFIYVVKFGDRYKIGWTTNPDPRLKSIQSQEQQSLDAVHVFPTDNARWCEKKLHHQFEDCNLYKEWFSLTPAQFAELQTIMGYWAGEYTIELSK